jgi:outer membrane protein OmpA-like peptidoglycan-associated protein
VAIAKAAQAERYAPDVLRKAEDFLARGEDYLARKQGEKAIGTVTRGAVQAAEDARLISIRRKREEDEAAKRHALEQQTADAQARAAAEAEQRAQADRDRQAADEQRRLAEQAKLEADQARQQAEAAKADALAQQQAAQAEAERARQAANQAEQDKEQTRQRLLAQLNQVLQTRESARGLIVSMPDVLFDFNKYTLKPGARERLAKVAGILEAYPGLTVQIEGHTDNVGSEEYNQKLSEQRANSVREFLVSQGVPSNSVTERGLGENDPVATNATAAGRQLNRRVDMVVNGEAIGGAGTTGAANTIAPGPNQPAMPVTNQPGTPMNTQPTTEIPH